MGNYYEQRKADSVNKRSEDTGDQALGNYYERASEGKAKRAESADQLLGNYCGVAARDNSASDSALGDYCG